jgi:sulfate transport system ATP-binding protein
MSISITKLNKNFGKFQALQDISLDVKEGELIALLGPSGSGKTTLLRMVSGLDFPDSGKIEVYDEDMTYQSVKDRQVGFVFQHYALFRHMTIFENVAFGLRVKPKPLRPSEEKIKEKVMELLYLVQLDGVADRYPSQLSGGQKQRIALARALAVAPKLLLLDEPFGALDARVRKELRRWLRNLHDTMNMTSLFVTHDQEEAMEVADRIVVMNHGRIEQVGTPDEVYNHPINAFVYEFLGEVNFFHGRDQHLSSTPDSMGYSRPKDVKISALAHPDFPFKGKVLRLQHTGPVVRLELYLEHTHSQIESHITQEEFGKTPVTSGQDVYVAVNNLRYFPTDYAI